MLTLQKLFKRGLDALVHPTIRLKATTDFPLTGKTLGVAYVVGFVLFMAGSLLPMLLLTALVYGLVTFADPEVAAGLLGWMFQQDGQPQPYFMGVLMVASFLGGFALQMQYLNRLLRRRGYRLLEVIGLSTAPMRGRNWLHTAWRITWRAALVFVFALAAEQVIGMFVHSPEQPTVDMARKLTGGSGWFFFALAGIAAPLLEEFCFRGILFQAVRATFHGYLARANGATIPGNTSRLGAWLGRNVFNTARRAEFGAVTVSAAVFALWHLQFDPMHLILLFGMGCLLAEVFRRTGTLWTSILVHAFNNGLMALIIMFGSR